MELVTWAPHDRTKFRYQLNKLLYTVLCLPVFTGGLSWGRWAWGRGEDGRAWCHLRNVDSALRTPSRTATGFPEPETELQLPKNR